MEKIIKREKKNGKNGNNEKKHGLISYDELPEYMKDNHFIINYYRANWPLNKAFFSLFQLHNETLNIWTHLIGFALFVWLTIANATHLSYAINFFGLFRVSPYEVHGKNSSSIYQSTNPLLDVTKPSNLEHTTPTPPTWPFYVYLSGSIICLLSSTLCHLFSCHSYHLNIWLSRLDYTGIAIMIITSFFPPIYYIFLCQPLSQLLYLTGITLIGSFTIITLFAPALSSGKWRPFRTGLFISMGLFGLVPAVHGFIMDWASPIRTMSLGYEGVMALAYLIGAGVYVTRIPERWRPGRFDLVGQSHQVFHVLVVVGALAHYGCALVLLEYRDQVGCSQ